MRIVKQNQFKNLGELHKEWTEAGVKASRAPHTDMSRNLATVVVKNLDWGWGQGIKEFSLAISSLYSVSYDPSEIIIICRFIIDGKKKKT